MKGLVRKKHTKEMEEDFYRDKSRVRDGNNEIK